MKLTKEFYTIREVSEILSVGPDKVEALCIEGDLASININPSGKRPTYRIAAKELQSFINNNSTQ